MAPAGSAEARSSHSVLTIVTTTATDVSWVDHNPFATNDGCGWSRKLGEKKIEKLKISSSLEIKNAFKLVHSSSNNLTVIFDQRSLGQNEYDNEMRSILSHRFYESSFQS